jgi:hypothetical protein
MGRVWQILRDLEPYILQFLLGAIAIGGLIKDWKDYGEKFGRLKNLRWLILLATVGVLLLTLLDTHQTRKDAREKEQQAQTRDAENSGHITDLTKQVQQERNEAKDARNDFRTSFASLYQRYSELLAKVRNADLLREIEQYRAELKTTQEKLTQPKPELVASFSQPTPTDIPTRQIDVVKSKDGTVTVDLTTINKGDGPALKGALEVRICWACEYAKEPERSNHVPGSDEQDREFQFEHIFSHTMTEKRTIEIRPKPFINRFQIDVHYVCENCVTDVQTLWVNLVPQINFPRRTNY